MKTTLSLPVNADLSATSVLHAEEIIRTALEVPETSSWYKSLSFVLVVPSQTFGLAMKLCHLCGYEINISTTFAVDEWELQQTDYSTGNIIAVFSPGA